MTAPDRPARDLLGALQTSLEAARHPRVEATVPDRPTPTGGPWTRHGHDIPGVTVAGGRPPAVARCGGPALCRQCREDVELAQGLEVQARGKKRTAATREQPARSIAARIDWTWAPMVLAGGDPRVSIVEQVLRLAEHETVAEVRALRADWAALNDAAELRREHGEALALIDDLFATFLIPHDDADPMHAGWTRGASVRADVAQAWRDRRAALVARTPQPAEQASVLVPRALLNALVEDDDCWFDHHGGCQGHGYLELEPGEKCPHAEAKGLLAAPLPAVPDGPTLDAGADLTSAELRVHAATLRAKGYHGAALSYEGMADFAERAPAVPDGEDATCSCCNGDPLTVCAACEQHSCWAGRFMCDESRTAGTKQASPSPNREDDDRPVRWAWAAWLAESAEQADDLDDSERHGLRIAATHLLEDDIAARLNPGDFDPVADPAWALRFTARLWADVETGRAARRASAPPDGKDVPARLDAAADALAETSGWQYPSNEVRRVAGVLRNVSPTARAAVAAALALPTEPEK